MNSCKLLFSGDFAPVGLIEGANDKELTLLFKNFIAFTASADLHISNLECPLTNYPHSINKTGPSIKSSPACIQALKKAKVDIACLANNHIRDFGDKGIAETLEICHKNSIYTVGAGMNKNMASKNLYKVVENFKLAFLNYCETEFSIAGNTHAGANPIDIIQIYNDIQQAKEQADFIFVILHGGHEYYPLPSPRLKKLFHYCADIGASAVIGHHSHVISGYEIYKGVPLIYSLGNFIFNDPENSDENWQIGLLAELVLSDTGKIVLQLYPVKQGHDELNMELMQGEAKEMMLNKIVELSEIIQNENELLKRWGQFAGKHTEKKVRSLYGLSLLEKAAVKLSFPQKLFIKKDRLLWLTNMLSNESHRELLINALEKEIKNAGWNS